MKYAIVAWCTMFLKDLGVTLDPQGKFGEGGDKRRENIFMAAAAYFLKSLQGYCGYKAAADTSVRQGDDRSSSGTVWPAWVMMGYYWCFLAVTAYSPRQQQIFWLQRKQRIRSSNELATFRLSGRDSSDVGGGISVASGGTSGTVIHHVDDGICVGW
mmetsp:Transcript_1326/g.1378  ORF Transcript_1326/g.1378 Transcript_1326/m.1378 type:complete len:157 (+) Transcript_1326:2144-2614(+)